MTCSDSSAPQLQYAHNSTVQAITHFSSQRTASRYIGMRVHSLCFKRWQNKASNSWNYRPTLCPRMYTAREGLL